MPGDRKSTCGGRMKPIGLTYKKDGELMIIHLCLSCQAISCNRIAGDDNAYTITCLLRESQTIDKKTYTKLTTQGIIVLTVEDTHDVLMSLYGCLYEQYSL